MVIPCISKLDDYLKITINFDIPTFSQHLAIFIVTYTDESKSSKLLSIKKLEMPYSIECW